MIISTVLVIAQEATQGPRDQQEVARICYTIIGCMCIMEEKLHEEIIGTKTRKRHPNKRKTVGKTGARCTRQVTKCLTNIYKARKMKKTDQQQMKFRRKKRPPVELPKWGVKKVRTERREATLATTNP